MNLQANISSSLMNPVTSTARNGEASGDAPSPSDLKMRKAAKDFESILLSSWLDEMRESFSGSLGGDDDDSAKTSVQGLAVSAVSSALAASGGVGIGKMILQSLQAGAPTDTLKVNQAQRLNAIKAFSGLADSIGGGKK